MKSIVCFVGIQWWCGSVNLSKNLNCMAPISDFSFKNLLFIFIYFIFNFHLNFLGRKITPIMITKKHQSKRLIFQDVEYEFHDRSLVILIILINYLQYSDIIRVVYFMFYNDMYIDPQNSHYIIKFSGFLIFRFLFATDPICQNLVHISEM